VTAEYLVVTPRIEGNPEIGYDTYYYSDNKRLYDVPCAIRHGVVVLDQSDDFLIGKVDGKRLVSLQWMERVRDDPDELADVAEQLGLNL